MLEYGSKGSDVSELQSKLNALISWGSVPKLVVDGDFGPATRSAVMLFQTQNGLAATGIVDGSTLQKLGLSVTAPASNGKGVWDTLLWIGGGNKANAYLILGAVVMVLSAVTYVTLKKKKMI